VSSASESGGRGQFDSLYVCTTFLSFFYGLCVVSPNSCKLHSAQIQVHLLLCLFHICTTFLTQRLRVVKGSSASKAGGGGQFNLVYMYVLLHLLFCPKAVCGIPQLQCIQPRHLLLDWCHICTRFPPRAVWGEKKLPWASFGRDICAFTTLPYLYGYCLTCFLFFLQGYLW